MRILVLACCALMLAPGTTAAAPNMFINRLGVGLIAGEPTGISMHYWLPGETAIQGAMAWKTRGKDELHLQADYLKYQMRSLEIDGGVLPVYYGIGVRFHDEDIDTHLGVRIPLGIDYHFRTQPIDVFFEISPALDLAPDTDFFIDGGVGIRYRFH